MLSSRSRRRFLEWFTFAAILVALAAVSLCIYWLVYPYNEFRMDPGPYPLTKSSTVENGIPVIPHGMPLEFTLTGPCNEGVDVITIRWFDLYDKYLFFEPDAEHPAASISVPPWEFYNSTTTAPDCPTETPVSVRVPDYIEHGLVYRFRFEITYKPNPIRTITVSATTEQFRLVDAPNT